MERNEVIKDPKKLELGIGLHGSLISHKHIRAGTALLALVKASPFSHLLSSIPTDVSSGVEGSWAQSLVTCWPRSLLWLCPDHVQK